MLDPRTPVLVGVGTAHRAPDGSAGIDPIDLMVEAVVNAGRDCAAPAMVADAALVAVPRGNWTYADPARLVAERVGCAAAHTVMAEIGVPQATPVNTAIDRIRRGQLDVALVVGGEAMASRLRSERLAGDVSRAAGNELNLEARATDDVDPDEVWTPVGEFMADPEIQAGIWAPVEQYACIDNALRHAEGATVDQQLDETAALWSRFNDAAQHHPEADFAEPRDAAFLRSAGPGNRPLAFPYAKWHVTQWSVDQAACLLLCSVGAALDAGVPRDRWVFPHVAIESSLSVSLTRRAALHRWPAMEVLGRAAATHIGRSVADVEIAELYSCFPVAVRIQQRELGLPLDGTPTVTGGMTFAGGPFNNFTYQATAAVVRRLREQPVQGLVTTVSGLLTKPGLAIWSTEPPPASVLVGDFGEQAGTLTATREVTGYHHGPATVVTSTVTYEQNEAAKAFVIADLDDGRRWVGPCRSPGFIARSVAEEVGGTEVHLTGGECHGD